MPRYLTTIWEEQLIYNLVEVEVEADSEEDVRNMSANRLSHCIVDYLDTRETFYDECTGNFDLDEDMVVVPLHKEQPKKIRKPIN